ncbi:site-specific DNA-methyltransferase [Pseudoclavibacter helvolus]|uniref:site-specific DNA-methyltransferase n=1 Tax=Pseudoclavibacter helvolus TaxID=255205 RepID=UPI0024AE72CC|nr:site-specific DNA-methyltransferase [Pseudoclavibacter helvolus]
MEKRDLHSPDLAAQNVDKIAALFPSVITEAADSSGNIVRSVDFDLLRQEFSDHIVEGPQERYRLDWPGKRAAAFAANAPIVKTLRPMREDSVNFDTTKNLFIEGDNLDALKLLQESYLGKVKLIYIDPPYNTGNDFIYDDDFAEARDDYLSRSGQRSEGGDRLVVNPETNGRFHSDWLSMMYARLKLARGLLTEDGIVIVAIDDHEHANLRSVLDMIFGADNFLADVVWQGVGKNDARFTAGGLDYMLIYARNQDALVANDARWSESKRGYDQVMKAAESAWAKSEGDPAHATTLLRAWWRTKPDTEKGLSMYSEIDETGQPFRRSPVSSPNPRVNLMFDVLHPITGKPVRMPSNGWRYSRESMAEKIKQKRMVFGQDESATVSVKTYLSEVEHQAIRPSFFHVRAKASEDLNRLLGISAFDYPKDVGVLSKWIDAVTGSDKEAIILDFFAGSGSTGHAVMNLNAADRGSRRFILVQLDEASPSGSVAKKRGYRTIAEIARERLRRAGEQLKEDVGLAGFDIDVGFRSLYVDGSNKTDVLKLADDTEQLGLEALAPSIKPDRSGEDLLVQVALDWGLDLSSPIRRETVDQHEILALDDDALVACFAESVTAVLVRTIAARGPLRAVFRDDAFRSDAARINAEQIFREVSPATEVRTI